MAERRQGGIILCKGFDKEEALNLLFDKEVLGQKHNVKHTGLVSEEIMCRKLKKVHSGLRNHAKEM